MDALKFTKSRQSSKLDLASIDVDNIDVLNVLHLPAYVDVLFDLGPSVAFPCATERGCSP